jgi:hypothetical protein
VVLAGLGVAGLGAAGFGAAGFAAGFDAAGLTAPDPMVKLPPDSIVGEAIDSLRVSFRVIS